MVRDHEVGGSNPPAPTLFFPDQTLSDNIKGEVVHMGSYPFKEIEHKWQKRWEELGLFKTPEVPKKKMYILEMFAYPSGDIHMGHFRNYTIGDVVARYYLMNNYDILHPFGWDAFGLPAEEAAIKRNIDPKTWTLNNINISRATLKRVGISYDWDREVITCNPDYYKWTQWIFLKLYEKGLAYQAEAAVNWCPSCKTVLANEQVEAGICWRCKSPVTKRTLTQWFFKITAYAERLLNDLDKLSEWPENVKIMQRNWIGKSQGAEFDFLIEDSNKKFTVFTTRPDTIFGVTFVAIAPEHPLATELARGTPYEKRVTDYVHQAQLKTEIDRTSEVTEKDGVFTGRYALNLISGERVQLWVADYVLPSYGTGIVMGVPAHDERDFQFAKKYQIPIKVVINPPGESLDATMMESAYVDHGIMLNSGQFDGLPSEEGGKKVVEYAIGKGIGRFQVNYRLRDWLISRQRYWGAPIPMIHCDDCGVVPVPETELPVLLPEEEKVDFIPKGRSPLEDVESFRRVKCPRCGKMASRDPDTMDTFVCSSWYHLRYVDPHNSKEPFSKEQAKLWLPIDLYIGGIEHATGHLLYFRFITKVLYDSGWLPVDEPAIRLFNHGMVLDENGEVMSKSKGNVVSPVYLMDKYGVDIPRIAMLFAAPSDKEVRWTDEGVRGATRFVNRIYRIYEQYAPTLVQLPEVSNKKWLEQDLSPAEQRLYRKLHQTLKAITHDLNTLEFNTAIAALMELLNQYDRTEINHKEFLKYFLRSFALMLAPLAPHLAEELWAKLGAETPSIFKVTWPEYDPKAIHEDEIELVIQINGKIRARQKVSADLSDEELKNIALNHEKIEKLLDNKKVKRVIVVKGRLVNIVV